MDLTMTGRESMRLISFAVICAALLLYASPALAKNPTSGAGYNVAAKVEADLDSATPAASSGDTLPLTGADVSVLLLGGAAIGLIGFAIRRTGKSKQ
jgi:hypothetical protein